MHDRTKARTARTDLDALRLLMGAVTLGMLVSTLL